MIRISNTQLFFLILSFEVGSTTLFALGIGAERDAWIVVVSATLIGLGLAWVYTEIPTYYPNQNFSEILNAVIGKKLAIPLLLLFGLYFYSQASHNFYEFGVLIRLTALPLTPLMLILFLFILVMIYILSLGFEVFARTCEILVPYLLLFLITVFILALFSGQFDFDALYPTLANGVQPILEELPRVIAFPFGEMVVFLMFWHYVKDQDKIRKTTFLAVGLSACLLMISLIVMLSVLGPKLTANAEIPLLETILAINIAEIITNLDSIAVFIMFIGGFYKTTLHFWGFCLAVTWLCNGKKGKWILVISGLPLPLFSNYRFQGFDVQRWIGTEMGIKTILLFSFLPVLILLIIFMKNKAIRR
ncbi:GerAB/ArcD/ProY family transporter [Halalkalibacter alkalisediminis]|uniref:GerAB/ArcD/ProY family transporter n=1 Tax=Halalkalibacter alkalisediminis TaxID=935616 RepID=A0ABV6NF98_9BACI|nr:GerAB/ArcD/ProY family transporter [Halalkalibacter alkalisediminis]